MLCEANAMPTRRRRYVVTETAPVQAALDELRGELGSDRRAAAEALFEAMGSEQFDLDLEAVDRLNTQPAA